MYMIITKEYLLSNITISESWCWEYRFIKENKRLKQYGRIQYRDENGKKKQILAHRASYEIHNWCKVPEWMFVCHSCDNPKCINPEHLFLWTPKDNTTDMFSKGRWSTKQLNKGWVFNKKAILANWVKYDSIADASRALWISDNWVRKRCKLRWCGYQYPYNAEVV